jgi:HSP20 family protein
MSTTTQNEVQKQPAREQQENGANRGYLSPQVNIAETKDGYVVEAEMPGVNKDSLEVLLEGNELTLIGHRKFDVPNAELLYRESATRDFRRSFVLDPAIDTGRINARMENGVLTLTLPKSEQVKPRKVVVE